MVMTRGEARKETVLRQKTDTELKFCQSFPGFAAASQLRCPDLDLKLRP